MSQQTVIAPVLGTTVHTPLGALASWARCARQLAQSVQAVRVGHADGEADGVADEADGAKS